MTLNHYLLPALPYAPTALEPYLEARTLSLHHDVHHAGYVKALNLAMQQAPLALQGRGVDWLLQHLDELPASITTAVSWWPMCLA